MLNNNRPEIIAYKNALERAWLDGVITYDEAKMLDSLREHLMITAEEHWELENDIKYKGPDPGIKEYKAALEQAWMDGILTDMEKEMLKKLREKYEITDDIHQELQKKVLMDVGMAMVRAQKDHGELLDSTGGMETPPFDSTDDNSAGYWVSEGKKLWSANGQCSEEGDKAIDCFDKALELEPNNHLVWMYKGAIYKKMGNIENAIQCYDRAIDLKNDTIASWYNKGVLLAQESLTQLEEAIKCFDEVLRINPANELAMRDREILEALINMSLDQKEEEKDA